MGCGRGRGRCRHCGGGKEVFGEVSGLVPITLGMLSVERRMGSMPLRFETKAVRLLSFAP